MLHFYLFGLCSKYKMIFKAMLTIWVTLISPQENAIYVCFAKAVVGVVIIAWSDRNQYINLHHGSVHLRVARRPLSTLSHAILPWASLHIHPISHIIRAVLRLCSCGIHAQFTMWSTQDTIWSLSHWTWQFIHTPSHYIAPINVPNCIYCMMLRMTDVYIGLFHHLTTPYNIRLNNRGDHHRWKK